MQSSAGTLLATHVLQFPLRIAAAMVMTKIDVIPVASLISQS